jgi:hypothetical protein
MGPIRKFGTALVIAGLMAGFTGTSLEAKKKPGQGGGPPELTVCTYLQTIIDYEYTSPTVLVYAMSLWNYFGCGAE